MRRPARAAGAVIVFVTARPPRGVREIAEQAGVTGTAICSNGAIVYDLDTDEITESLPLDPGAARRAARALAEALPGVGLAVETGRGVLAEAAYTRRVPEDMPFYREVVSVLEEAEPFVKLLAHSPAHTADEMIAAVPATVKGLAEITQSGYGGLVGISAPGVTKAPSRTTSTASRRCWNGCTADAHEGGSLQLSWASMTSSACAKAHSPTAPTGPSRLRPSSVSSYSTRGGASA
ncbi:HAD family hydrolase [Nonomuraea wenchangensis]|uniref:HAD family hydrolase n=1 Tax=Nonomuraea wenchangensis TaxID=568860 RepID=UPI003F4DB059